MNLMRFFNTVVISSFLLLIACGGSADVIPIANAGTSNVTQVEEIDTLHAILRPDINGKWYIQTNVGPVVDADHSSSGISWSIEQTNEYVRIFFFRQDYTHAGVVFIQPDDDFVGKIQAGANLGLNSSTIRMVVNGQRINPWEINRYIPDASQAGNFWILIRMKKITTVQK